MQKSGGSRNAAYVSSGGKSIKEMEDSFVRDSRSGRLVSEAEKRERQAFFAEVQRVKARIHSVAWSTVNPQGRFIARWDVVTAFALVFTALVTPFEVGFYNRGTDLYIGPINFTLNRIVDAIFLADIVIQFFLPFRLPSSQGGRMVYDTSVIRRHYLRGWFPYDVLTCFPFDLLVGGITAASGGSFDGLVGPNLLRVFKFLRFMKLMRVLRIGRIIHRWQDHVGVSLVFLSLMQSALFVLLLAHWLACFWGFVGTAYSSPGSEWLSYDQRITWRHKSNVPPDAAPFDVYWIALYVATSIIFGSACDVVPATYYECAIVALMQLLGATLWAYVIASACAVFATLDPAQIEYRQTIDALNYFCREQVLPSDLRVRLREYFRNTAHVIRAQRYDVLLDKMSVRLRGDTAFRMCEFRLRQVPYLMHPDVEPEFLCSLALKFTTRVYSHLERVPCHDLFIVERGVIAKHGKLGAVGACFGLDVILANVQLRDASDAIALIFSQTTCLCREDIFELLEGHPRAHGIVRRAALRMALARSLQRAVKLSKRSSAQHGAECMDISLSEVFDRAMTDAADQAHRAADAGLSPTDAAAAADPSASAHHGAALRGALSGAPSQGGGVASGGAHHGAERARGMWNRLGRSAVREATHAAVDPWRGVGIMRAPEKKADTLSSLGKRLDEGEERMMRRMTGLEATMTKLMGIVEPLAAAVNAGSRAIPRRSCKRLQPPGASAPPSNQISNHVGEQAAVPAHESEERREMREAVEAGSPLHSCYSCSSPFDA